jgi:hypothetical protein
MERVFPGWVEALNDEDLHFLKRFALSSGSLKDVAKQYGISYPTVRARIDRLIAKIEAADRTREADALERTVQLMVADGLLHPAAAGKLVEAHRKSAGKEEGGEAQ